MKNVPSYLFCGEIFKGVVCEPRLLIRPCRPPFLWGLTEADDNSRLISSIQQHFLKENDVMQSLI